MSRTFVAIALAAAVSLYAAPPDRVTAPVDAQRIVTLPEATHRLAAPQFDRGAVDPGMRMENMMLLTRPSTGQQNELKQLLTDQQNPSSSQFHKWLTPEQFGDRFGLSVSDHSKVVAWLAGQGFEIRESGRARNWVMFSGTAGQVETALLTKIHRYEVNGVQHFANATPVSVPEALAGVIGGFTGLHDFQATSTLKTVTPDFTNGTTHFLVPEDFYTIYDVSPVAVAGFDGTGVNIGVMGTSQIRLSDVDAFRAKYNLPPKDPITVLVGTDPGPAVSQTEADLDVEWSNAIAPGATVYFYYSNSVTTSITGAVNANIVHIISNSISGPEVDNPTLSFEPIMQQANAQGITSFAGTGDNGAAGYASNSGAFDVYGPLVRWPSSYPEVTAMGGTQFDDTANPGAWWAPTNDANSGSALSYIPEIAWANAGGGTSAVFPKPVWQVAAGVPQDGARDVPDISLDASLHDAREIISAGNTVGVGGVSCSSPSMAGILALLNQYLVANGQIQQPGLGNINPQIYRIAQLYPNAFHDITSGSNTEFCLQGTVGCATGTFGYTAGPGYDLATGIGTLDVNNLISQWNYTTNAVNVTFSVSPSSGTFNDTFQLSAVVTPISGNGVPTGAVDFSGGTIVLGSAALDATSGQATAILSVPGYLFLTAGAYNLTARYSGDAAYSGGGAKAKVQIGAPSGVSSIVPSVPVSVSGTPTLTGPVWRFTMGLLERGGVAAVLTGVNLDGQDQPVAQFFSSTSIPANGSITSAPIVFSNLAYPLLRTFIFTGIDANGQPWSRQAGITFLAPATNVEAVSVSAIPMTMHQDPTADASCQWSQQLVLNEYTGFPQTISDLKLGTTSIAARIPLIFGTTQLAPYGALRGTICWVGETVGGSDTLTLSLASGLTPRVTVSFAGPQANPSPISVNVSSLNLSTATPQGMFAIMVPDGQSWSIGITPQNVTNGWLSVSPTTGTGSAQIVVAASGTGFTPGAYLANLIVQGPNLSPSSVTVPVTFVNGDSSGVNITGLTNAASGQSVAAPGMLAILQGTGLYVAGRALTISNSSGGPAYVFDPSAITIYVNGIPAAFTAASPTGIKFQIPYETNIGPAVVGISYQENVGGYVFQVAPSAPGIFADASGSVGSAQAGGSITLTMTGDGVTSPAIGDGTPGVANLVYKPALPITLTIGGVPASVTSYGIAAGAFSTTTLNVAIPSSVTPGVQPVVVTVAGVPSPPVNLTITQ